MFIIHYKSNLEVKIKTRHSLNSFKKLNKEGTAYYWDQI